MAIVWTTVTEPGIHRSPNGDVVITPTRAEHWDKQFHEMQKAGLAVPIPWGHTLAAVPENPAEATFLSSRYNAGYVKSIVRDPKSGKLAAQIDVPSLELDKASNCLVDKETRTAIKEVSVGIAKEWPDGKGRVWKDVITHIALTPHPVIAGQKGFQADMQQLAAKVKEDDVIWFATTPKTWQLAKENEMPKELFEKEEKGEGKSETEQPPESETPPEKKEPDTMDFANTLRLLNEHGIALPEDTDEKNGWERLGVALTALHGKLTKEEDSYGVREETPDVMMMSLLNGNPAMRALYEERNQEKKAQYKSLLENLKKRGLKKQDYDRIALELNSFRMSLSTVAGAPAFVAPALVKELEILDRNLPADGSPLIEWLSKDAQRNWTAPGDATAHENQNGQTVRDDALIDEMAGKIGYSKADIERKRAARTPRVKIG